MVSAFVNRLHCKKYLWQKREPQRRFHKADFPFMSSSSPAEHRPGIYGSKKQKRRNCPEFTSIRCTTPNFEHFFFTSLSGQIQQKIKINFVNKHELEAKLVLHIDVSGGKCYNCVATGCNGPYNACLGVCLSCQVFLLLLILNGETADFTDF